MHLTLRPDLDSRNGEPAGLTNIAGEQSAALDRAGMPVFQDIKLLAAGPASERSRSAVGVNNGSRLDRAGGARPARTLAAARGGGDRLAVAPGGPARRLPAPLGPRLRP